MKTKRKTSLISEIIISLVVLMVAATVLITITVLWTVQLQGKEQAFTPVILVLYILLFGLVIVIFGSLSLSNLLIRPLRKLVYATEKIGRGNFDVQVKVDSSDELGQLAAAFNQMTEELAHRQKNLTMQLEELERMNRELRKTHDQLIISEKLASVGKLAAGIAHEIGNPLSSIAGYLEIISRSKNLDEQGKDLLSRVDSELRRISQIIRELLDYSRAPAAELEFVDINAVIAETLKLIEVQKGFLKIKTELELDQSLPMVQATRSQLKQVLINLFLNALDAMPEGGTLKIKTCAAESSPKQVIAEVTDTGTGIEPQNLSKIFDPFFTTKEPGKGVGLGLSVSLNLIEVMNGKIEVESEPGKGSTFRLRFKCGG